MPGAAAICVTMADKVCEWHDAEISVAHQDPQVDAELLDAGMLPSQVSFLFG